MSGQDTAGGGYGGTRLVPSRPEGDVAVTLDYLWAKVVLLWERPVQRAEAEGTMPRRPGRARVAAVVAEALELLRSPREPWVPRDEADDGPYSSGGTLIRWSGPG